jgi:hypothetical protein
VVGTLTVTGDAAIDNVTVNGNTVSTSSGNLTLDSNGGTVAVADNITVSGNGSVTGTFDVDGATTLDGLTVAEGASFSSTLGVTGTTTLSGALVANGNIDLGNATSDTITATGRFDSDLVPSTDGARDLGTSTLEWQDLFIDGTAKIDTLTVDENATVAGNFEVTGTATFNTALANSNLANSTVSYGGISLSLGGSDATPAFDLTDATNYPTSSLTGTITNAQLAGSIASGKLAATGVSAGTVGSSTAIPIITVNAQGQITNTSTTAVDSTTIENGSASVAVTENGPITSTGNHDFTAGIDVTGNSTFANNVTITGSVDANGGASIDNVQVGVTNDNEIDTSTGNLVIDSAGGTVTVDDNLTVSGNLTVNGTTTTINSTTVAIDDKNFQVATGAADDAAADGAGLTVDSGDGDKTFNFEATGDNWGASENLNLASGKVYKINNSSILSATTLGSSVVSSSLTSVGTIASGVWNGTAIANAYLANSTVNFGGITLSLGGSDATPAFDLSDATNYPTSSLSGTITNAQLAGSIAASKLAGSIGNSKLSNSSVSYGGVSLSLGGSDATPAFDLSDATNYPTSSLSGTITNAQLAGSIANSKLSNNSVTVGGTEISLGGTATDLSGLNSIVSSEYSVHTEGQTNSITLKSGEILFEGSSANAFETSIQVTDPTADRTITFPNVSGNVVTTGDTGTVTATMLAANSVNTSELVADSVTAAILDDTGVSAGSYGSATAIPAITVDAQGRITALSTNTVNTTTNLGKSTATGQITITSSTGDNVVIGEATSSIAGLMSTTHHDKLDGIASGATNVTNTNQLTNGAGFITSADGGNAATLDSLDSTQFLRSDTSDTFSGTLTVSGNIVPNANGTRDLGTSSTRWQNIYTSDVDLNNQAKGGNTIDGSWGSYLIEEGENDLFLKNRRSGKTYRFMLQEV